MKRLVIGLIVGSAITSALWAKDNKEAWRTARMYQQMYGMAYTRNLENAGNIVFDRDADGVPDSTYYVGREVMGAMPVSTDSIVRVRPDSIFRISR